MAMAMATEKKKMEDDPSSSSSSESDPCEASSSSAADDLISSLPDCVLSHILSFVPIEESARTSVLSSQWRQVWTLSPLQIDDRSLNHNKQQYPFVLYRRTIIDTILARHRGPIHTFRLSNRLFIGDGTLDRWTETLAQRGIQSLSLFYCPFARRLHTCQSLHSLELVGCDLRGPLALLLPPNLKELKLRQTEITQNSLSHILSSCRALHTLELHGYPYIKNAIRISSPCLRKLTIDDLVRFDDISALHLLIEDAPDLELLIFGKYLTEWITTVKVINAPKLWLLGFVSASLGTIQFGEACFQLERRINFNTRMHSLKTLAIKVNFCDAHQAKVLFGLLRFFPCLENLTILSKDKDSPDPTDTEYWEQEESFDCLDHHLKSVKIKEFYGKHDDLGFARFLIQHAKVLKVISLLCQFYLERKWEETILRQLQFKNRASLDAQVIFMKVHSISDR